MHYHEHVNLHDTSYGLEDNHDLGGYDDVGDFGDDSDDGYAYPMKKSKKYDSSMYMDDEGAQEFSPEMPMQDSEDMDNMYGVEGDEYSHDELAEDSNQNLKKMSGIPSIIKYGKGSKKRKKPKRKKRKKKRMKKKQPKVYYQEPSRTTERYDLGQESEPVQPFKYYEEEQEEEGVVNRKKNYDTEQWNQLEQEDVIESEKVSKKKFKQKYLPVQHRPPPRKYNNGNYRDNIRDANSDSESLTDYDENTSATLPVKQTQIKVYEIQEADSSAKDLQTFPSTTTTTTMKTTTDPESKKIKKKLKSYFGKIKIGQYLHPFKLYKTRSASKSSPTQPINLDSTKDKQPGSGSIKHYKIPGEDIELIFPNSANEKASEPVRKPVEMNYNLQVPSPIYEQTFVQQPMMFDKPMIGPNYHPGNQKMFLTNGMQQFMGDGNGEIVSEQHILHSPAVH